MPTIKWFFRFYGHTNIINITWPPIRFGSRKVAKKPFNWKLNQQSFADMNILIGCTYFWPWTQWSLKFERAASSTRMCQSLTNLREFLLWFLGFLMPFSVFSPLVFPFAHTFFIDIYLCVGCCSWPYVNAPLRIPFWPGGNRFPLWSYSWSSSRVDSFSAAFVCVDLHILQA